MLNLNRRQDTEFLNFNLYANKGIAQHPFMFIDPCSYENQTNLFVSLKYWMLILLPSRSQRQLFLCI